MLLPPDPRLTVPVPLVKVELAPDVSQVESTKNTPLVMEIVEAVPSVMVTVLTLTMEVLATNEPALVTVRSKSPDTALPLVVSVPAAMESAWLTSMEEDCMIVPETVTLPTLLPR